MYYLIAVNLEVYDIDGQQLALAENGLQIVG
jgi:hypothetical protein